MSVSDFGGESENTQASGPQIEQNKLRVLFAEVCALLSASFLVGRAVICKYRWLSIRGDIFNLYNIQRRAVSLQLLVRS